MSSTQKYISGELTHFVGSNDKSLEKQYCILKKILNDKKLCPSGDCALRTGYSYNSGEDVTDNKKFDSQGVSFSDIPNTDLNIHIAKYGKCGLSFEKPFIAAKGGKPVHYIPLNGNSRTNKINREYFNELIPKLTNMLLPIKSLIHLHQDEKLKRIKDFKIINDFIKYELLGYLKFYDHKLSDKDEKNYYFEREWRVLDQVKFSIKDVKRIFIPESYQSRLREEVKDICEFNGDFRFT